MGLSLEGTTYSLQHHGTTVGRIERRALDGSGNRWTLRMHGVWWHHVQGKGVHPVAAGAAYGHCLDTVRCRTIDDSLDRARTALAVLRGLHEIEPKTEQAAAAA